MASKAMIPFLISMMLLTGVCNTLLTKYQDNQCVSNCTARDPTHRHNFEQPVLQTAQMFLGEMGCWLVMGLFKLYDTYISKSSARRAQGYEVVGGENSGVVNRAESVIENEDEGNGNANGGQGEVTNPVAKIMNESEAEEDDDRVELSGWNTTLLALPAICDICGTTLMNIGLLFVVASIYQMTRGALVLFVGLFSVLFLKRRLEIYQWAALVTVVVGVGIVGVAGAMKGEEKISIPHDESQDGGVELIKAVVAEGGELARLVVRTAQTPEALRTIIGILLIAGAQIFTATQFVVEEWILEKFRLEPIKVVGWEGTFGFGITALGMAVGHLVVGRTEAGRGGYFDVAEGLRQVFEVPAIGWSSLLIMCSIGGFNFFGLSVTRTVSATSRSTIDTCRTLFIWIVSLGLGWESFKALQVVGFALLVYGTFLFNGIVRSPLERCVGREKKPEVVVGEEGLGEHV